MTIQLFIKIEHYLTLKKKIKKIQSIFFYVRYEENFKFELRSKGEKQIIIYFSLSYKAMGKPSTAFGWLS